jgi:hypothetical protein
MNADMALRTLTAAATLVLAFGARAAQPGDAQGPDQENEHEIPIAVPTPIPVGISLAWKPTFLSVRADNGLGTQFGSDKFQPVRGLARYTTTLLDEKLMARAEVEAGQFQTDTANIGTQGWDMTVRLLGGTATRLSQKFAITASAGLLTRYQHGRAQSAAPNFGVLGITSNLEFEYRFAPLVSASFYLEGGLAPVAYGSQARLGELSDASELRGRVQVSLDVTSRTAVDVGYEYTRWHSSFTGSALLRPGAPADRVLLLEAREHAMTISIRWKP